MCVSLPCKAACSRGLGSQVVWPAHSVDERLVQMTVAIAVINAGSNASETLTITLGLSEHANGIYSASSAPLSSVERHCSKSRAVMSAYRLGGRGSGEGDRRVMARLSVT